MHTTAVKAQAQTTKDPKAEEPKARGPKPSLTPQRSNNNELSDKVWKEKKKEQRRRDRERREGSTSTTGVNSAHTGKPQKKKNQGRSDRASRDTSQIKCYNCQKMGHYANKCPEPKN